MRTKSIFKDAEFMSSYIQEDNRIAALIYDSLYSHFEKSLNNIPNQKNIFGIFFIDILKLLTGSTHRHREIQHNLLVDNNYNHTYLEKFPYIGYAELLNGVLLDKKEYGKKLIETKYTNICKFISYFSKLFGRGKTILMQGDPIYKDYSYLSILHGNKIELLQPNNFQPHFPDIDHQLSLIRECIAEISDELRLPLTEEIYFEIIKRHVSLIIAEGDMPDILKADAMICGSGVELSNRIFGALAIDQSIPVLNIAHGDSFGVLDHPIFEIGEQLYGTALLGYGNQYVEDKNTYKHVLPKNISTDYIPSSSKFIKKIYTKSTISNELKGKIFYFPTSLRGDKHRYGPYQDCPDYFYLEWQKYLVKLFENNLIVKIHPKDSYAHLYKKVHSNYISENLMDILYKVDVFIFDYISTAFSIAAATDKPIIYFDLGIQNIHENAMEKIKRRALTISLHDLNKVSVKDLSNMLNQFNAINDYTENYSLTPNSDSREEILLKYINKE